MHSSSASVNIPLRTYSPHTLLHHRRLFYSASEYLAIYLMHETHHISFRLGHFVIRFLRLQETLKGLTEPLYWTLSLMLVRLRLECNTVLTALAANCFINNFTNRMAPFFVRYLCCTPTSRLERSWLWRQGPIDIRLAATFALVVVSPNL